MTVVDIKVYYQVETYFDFFDEWREGGTFNDKCLEMAVAYRVSKEDAYPNKTFRVSKYETVTKRTTV